MEPYGMLRSPKEPKNIVRNPKDLGSKGLGIQDGVRVESILARIILVSFVIAYKIISFSCSTLLSKTSKKWIMFLMDDP